MNGCRRFLPIVMLLAILTLSLLSGCAKEEGTFEPYTIPVFSTASSDLNAQSEQIAGKLDLSGNSSFRIDDMGMITYSRSESGDYYPI